jgi:hypothetical protein
MRQQVEASSVDLLHGTVARTRPRMCSKAADRAQRMLPVRL